MDNSDPTDLHPVAFWYSDEGMYTPGMKRIDKFEEGKHYMHSVMLRQKNGYEFANGCTVAINGEPLNAMSVQKVEDGLFLAPTTSFTCEKALVWQAIDTVEINGATVTFKDGDKPVFTGATSDDTRYWYQCEFWNSEDGAGVNSAWFWDQNIENHIDTFEAGKTYSYGFYLKSHEGFYFTRDTRVTINGKTYGYWWNESDAENLDRDGKTTTMWVYTNLTMTPEATPAPTPDPRPTPDSEPKPDAKPGQAPTTATTTTTVSTTKTPAVKPTAKTTDATLAATGDSTGLVAAAMSLAGAIAAAIGIASKRREN